MKIRIIGMPPGLDPNEKHGMVYESLDGDTITYRYVPPERGQETASCTHGADCELHPQIGQLHNFDREPYTGKRIELRRDRRPHEGYDYELHITPEGGNTTGIERLTNADLDELRRVIARPQATSPDAMAREGDRMVAQLSPDAQLVVDEATCIVLRTPERRITVSNVNEWREQLAQSRTFAEIYRDEAEALRRDEKQAADHMYAGHIASLRDRDKLIEHLHRSPDHGENTDAQLSGLIGMTTLDLIREHQHKHGLR